MDIKKIVYLHLLINLDFFLRRAVAREDSCLIPLQIPAPMSENEICGRVCGTEVSGSGRKSVHHLRLRVSRSKCYLCFNFPHSRYIIQSYYRHCWRILPKVISGYIQTGLIWRFRSQRALWVTWLRTVVSTFLQKEGQRILLLLYCRREGNGMPVKEPPQWRSLNCSPI
jgi:hypothetical protein